MKKYHFYLPYGDNNEGYIGTYEGANWQEAKDKMIAEHPTYVNRKFCSMEE